MIEKIIDKVVRMSSGGDHGALAISERHKQALLIALDDVKKSENMLETGFEPDFLPAATHARSALEQIGFIFGKNCTEEMLDTIFSRFCVGK